MDILTFISKIIESIAWPLAVIVSIFILRKSLQKLIPNLKSAKYKGIELKFGEKLEELESRANQASLPEEATATIPIEQNPDEWTFGDYIERLAPISPRVAVSEAWRLVELAVRDTLKTSGYDNIKNTSSAIKLLAEKGKLPKEGISLLYDLKGLRNQAVHSAEFDLTEKEAIEFGKLAERLIATIKVAELDSTYNN